MEILRRGCEGEDVRRWQHFRLGQELLEGSVDGVFGPLTEKATKAFQRKRKLTVDGMVGPQTLAAALNTGLDLGFTDPLGGTSGPDWPAPPAFKPLISNLERGKIFWAARSACWSPARARAAAHRLRLHTGQRARARRCLRCE